MQETLVHSSNSLAIKVLRNTKKHLNFVKSCITFSEVTIPSVTAFVKQLKLYLETAEVSNSFFLLRTSAAKRPLDMCIDFSTPLQSKVALMGGLVSHSYGLIDSAISCLQSLDWNG